MNEKELVLDLNSPFWYTRARAIKQIEECENKEFLRALYLEIESKHDDTLRMSLLESISRILFKKNIDLIGESIIILLLESEVKSPKIRNEAKRQLKVFLESQEVPRFIKVLGLKNCLIRLPLNRRANVTRLIGEYKISELVPFLLQNFVSKEVEMHIETINVLVRLEDRRGNSKIKQLLKSQENSHVEFALRSIGKLGSFFDLSTIYPFLKNHSSKIRSAAIYAFVKILDYYSLFFLLKIYRHENNRAVKKDLLHVMGKLQYRLSSKLLLLIYCEEQDLNLVQYCEWSLHQLSRKFLIQEMFSKFFKQDDSIKFKLLKVVSEINDPKIIPFLHRIFSEETNEFILVEAFDIASTYNDVNLLFEVKKYLYSNSENLKYYSLLSCLKHTCFNRRELYLEWIEKENLSIGIVQILLKFSNEHFKDIERDDETLLKARKFVVSAMKSQSFEVKVSAISFAWKYSDEDIFNFMYHHFLAEKNSIVKKTYVTSFVKLLAVRPGLLARQPEILNHKDIIKSFHPSKATNDFWNHFLLNCSQFEITFFDSFLAVHIREVATSLLKWLDQTDVFDNVDVVIHLLHMSQIEIDPEHLFELMSKIYIWSNDRSKYEILKILALSGETRFFDFIWFESMKEDHFSEQRYHLLNIYYEASNE